jgi:hypothetical protein
MAENWLTVRSDGGVRFVHRMWHVGLGAAIQELFPPSPTIVNIGIYYGASMYAFRRGAPDADLWGVDIKHWGFPSLTLKRPETLGAQYIWDDSTEVHSFFTLPIHLLYLSGVQAYPGVSQDIEGWCQKVVEGGIVAFCCYHLPAPRWATKQAWDEWQEVHPSKWKRLDSPRPMQAFRRLK